MIYLREALDKDGNVVHSGVPTRHASCWGLFEEFEDDETVATYRLAVYSPAGLARIQQEAFVNGKFVQELTDNLGFRILGYNDVSFFKGKHAKWKNWTSAGWAALAPESSGFAVLEFSADIPADRLITAGRLLTSFKYFGQIELKALPEKLYQFSPLLLQLPFNNGEISSDSYATLVPVTAEAVRELNGGEMLDDWGDDDDDPWGSFVRDYKNTHSCYQTHESILEILQRDSAAFGELSSQRNPIRRGYRKDDDLYYDEAVGDGILTVSAPITNTAKVGQKAYAGQADLFKFLLKHM